MLDCKRYVYYSSFDASQGQYLLSKLTSSPVCVNGSVDNETDCSSDTWQNRRCVGLLTTEATCLADSSTNYWSPYQTEIILSNFEAYNVSKSGSDTELWPTVSTSAITLINSGPLIRYQWAKPQYRRRDFEDYCHFEWLIYGPPLEGLS